jgi:hypothetical protein
MDFSLKPLILPKPIAATLIMLLLLMLWIVVYQFVATDVECASPSQQALNIQNFFNLNYSYLLLNIISIFFTLLNTWLIYLLNNKFTIIRIRTFLPVFIYLLLISVWYQTHYLIYAHFANTLFLLSLFVFFNMYRNRNSTEQAFLGTLLLASGSLIIEPLILFVPIYWYNFIHYNCFSLRTFLASLFGMLAPWAIFISINILIQPDNQWFNALIEPFQVHSVFLKLTTAELIYIGILLIFSIIFLVEMFFLMKNDSRQTRAKLNIVLSFGIAAALFALFFHGQYQLFMPFVAFSYAILFAHPLALKLSIFNTILFILFIIINLLYLVYNII